MASLALPPFNFYCLARSVDIEEYKGYSRAIYLRSILGNPSFQQLPKSLEGDPGSAGTISH